MMASTPSLNASNRPGPMIVVCLGDRARALDHAAETYARIGNADAALALFERLLGKPTVAGLSVHDLRLGLRWDRLRGDTRFRRLVQ
jgi:hypothetical protein